ncbi:unnamed protein product [Sphacelaria rigidula]
MQDVFLGKGTWAVLCSGGDSGEHTAVSKRFDTAARALKGSVKFGVVDCTGSLPSGKSVLQKFDLAQEVQPVLFVTGPGMKSVQAPSRNMETHGALQKWIQGTAEPGASAVTSTRELESKCLKKSRCALIMKAGPLEDRAKDAFKDLMMRHRNLRFVSVDAAKLETSVEKKLGLEPFEGAHQLLYFTRYNVGDKPKVGTARWGVQVYDGDVEPDAMSTFIDDATQSEDKEQEGTATTKTKISGGKKTTEKNSKIFPLTRLPTVMTRKEPKVKKPPPPPPRPDPAAAGTAAGGEGASAAEDGDLGQYSGMDKEKLLEQFRAKQAEREAARRKAMDTEADNYLFEAVDEGKEGVAGGGEGAGLEWGSGSDRAGDSEGDGEEEDDFEDIVDLDEI